MKYKNMEVEYITKDNLPKIAELLGDESLLAYDDICFEHSMYSMNKKGEITSVVILRRNSLFDYYGGDIPDDINFEEHKDVIRQSLNDLYPDGNVHYEMVGCYLKSRNYFIHIHELYHLIGILPTGIVWCKYNTDKEFPLHCVFYNFNNDIWIHLSIED